MPNQKVLRGSVDIRAFDPEAFANPATPTTAELNGLLGYNISCAILDDYTLNMTDSDTDDSRSVCDIGQVATPTYQNYEASLDGFRDDDEDATGVYNLFRDLFRAPDVPYILVKRIGPAQGTAYAIGQVISMYTVNTDLPIDGTEDNSPLTLGARFKPQGGLNVNYTIAS